VKLLSVAIPWCSYELEKRLLLNIVVFYLERSDTFVVFLFFRDITMDMRT